MQAGTTVVVQLAALTTTTVEFIIDIIIIVYISTMAMSGAVVVAVVVVDGDGSFEHGGCVVGDAWKKRKEKREDPSINHCCVNKTAMSGCPIPDC